MTNRHPSAGEYCRFRAHMERSGGAPRSTSPRRSSRRRALWRRAPGGARGGPRPSAADYVAVTGPRGGVTTVGEWLWHGLLGQPVTENGCGMGSWGSRSPRMPDYVAVTGPLGAAESHGPQGNPVQFPDSYCIPTSIPSELPRIAVSGRVLGQDENDAAIQATSTSKVRRVDFGDCMRAI